MGEAKSTTLQAKRREEKEKKEERFFSPENFRGAKRNERKKRRTCEKIVVAGGGEDASRALALSRAPQARTAHTPHDSLRAHTAPHSATPPPMRQTRGGKRRLFLPGQKRYGLSQKRSKGLSFFSSDRRARESNRG